MCSVTAVISSSPLTNTAKPVILDGVVRVPSAQTLRRYGLTETDWRRHLRRQGGVCGVCGKVPPSGTLHIEHEHVRGFKDMPPEQKRRYVRGLACWWCNANLLRRGTTPAKLRAAADYLEAYEERKADG